MNVFSSTQWRVVHAFHSVAFVFIFSSLLLGGPTYATTLQIQLGGVNIVFDGTDIDDAGSSVSGAEDPADADPLDTVTFTLDDTPVGTLVGPPVGTDAIFVDIHIPGVPSIPAVGGAVTTAGIPTGTFDLLTTAVAPAVGLALDLDAVHVTYVPIANNLSFVFSGSVASIDSQDLPFGLEIGAPVTVTLSTQTSSVTIGGGFVTSFTASGTGEIRGAVVPEPSALSLAVVAFFGLLARSRRRRA